jgi:hypothetical protein
LGPGDSNSLIDWMNGGSPAAPYEFSLNGGQNWDSGGVFTAQFQIDGVLAGVPEPSSFLLTGVTLLLSLCFGGAKFRQRG